MPNWLIRASILAALLAGLPCVAAKADSPLNLRRTVTVEVVAKTKDAVVNISTTTLVSRRISPFGDDPFWQQFGPGQTVEVPANSLGSGLIVHSDGYVVTNNHVVDRARQITVELADGRKLPGELLSADAEADLAIIRVHSDRPLPAIELGDSSDLMIGEPVIAVGNPLGYSHSVSTGIVSALHRDLNGTEGHVILSDLIQTDAAINPGNSGGPLLNAYGQVIGINTAIRSDAQNIGFSIPVDRLRDLVPELMSPAQVTKVELPLKLREKRTITEPATVAATIVDANSDQRVVDKIDGRHPRNIIDAYAMLEEIKAGQSVHIDWADGKSQTFAATAVATPDAIVQARQKLGIVIQQLTPMLAEKNHLQTEDGLLVTEVIKNSAAATAGIQPGDVIVQIGRYRVATLNDLSTLLGQLPTSGRLRVTVIRGDQVGTGIITLGT